MLQLDIPGAWLSVVRRVVSHAEHHQQLAELQLQLLWVLSTGFLTQSGADRVLQAVASIFTSERVACMKCVAVHIHQSGTGIRLDLQVRLANAREFSKLTGIAASYMIWKLWYLRVLWASA